jgi:hypothetical protein
MTREKSTAKTLLLVMGFMTFTCGLLLAQHRYETSKDSEVVPAKRTPPSPQAGPKNKVSAILGTLPIGQQRVLLAETVRVAGFSCPEVTRVKYRGRGPAETAFWTVQCPGSDDFSISIEATDEGASKVVACQLLEVMNQDCWAPLR